MGNILDQIIEQKQMEVQNLRENRDLIRNFSYNRKSLIDKLQNSRDISIIAEFKRASPSKGIINKDISPAAQAAIYAQHGASAISVLTDKTFFKGSFADLETVRETVNLPILCKDFIIDRLQIDAAASYGADLILLIAAALKPEKLKELYQYARESGLEVLVEVHNQRELDEALKTGTRLIGINNRNLKTFKVSLEVTENLAANVKKAGAFLISESGLQHQEDVVRVRNAGANGILVGEALMKCTDLGEKFLSLRLPLIEGANR